MKGAVMFLAVAVLFTGALMLRDGRGRDKACCVQSTPAAWVNCAPVR